MDAVHRSLADRDQLHRYLLKTRAAGRLGSGTVGNAGVYLQNNKDESNAVIQQENKAVNEEKAQELIDQPVPQPAAHSEPNILSEVADAIKPIRAKKDTFISNGALFTGVIEGDGNIIVEGRVEGNIICSHMVRIETSGHVKGEIRAQQITINGPVEGRCFADSLSIQPKGSMRGDIFADEISIEKGGLFIGQSQLMQKTPPQAQPAQAKVTALKKVEPEQQEQPTPQPSKHAN
ncbi:bactofilin family protein [Serratia fonticola]|uniref:bactofilin family protein n=1 Tax=Serratia fonticola TaxID=47917 RepID=UPI0012690986|nr:polymer-forming cytoskeletal protein [Serratia fonticola]